MRKPRAQSAMEFLMTYGWAILIIIIVVAVLFYMGVMNPKNTRANSCLFPPGMSCASSKLLTDGTMQLTLGQATGHRMVVTSVSCTKAQEARNWSAVTPNVSINSGESGYVGRFMCTNADGSIASGDLGESGKFKLWVRYTEYSEPVEKIIVGDFIGRYEAPGGSEGTPLPSATPTPTPSPTPSPTPVPTPGTCSGAGCACYQPTVRCVPGSPYDTACTDAVPPCEYAAGQQGICCRDCADDPDCACVSAPAGCAAIGQQDCSWSPTTAPCYLADNSKKCCKPVPTPIVVASGLSGPGSMQLYNGYLYFVEYSANNIHRVAIGGGTVENVAISGLSGPAFLDVADDTVFFSDNLNSAVKKVAITGGTVTTLAGGYPYPRGIAYDGGTIYWAGGAPGWPTDTYKVSASGGGVTSIDPGNTGGYGLDTDGAFVYWSDGSIGSDNIYRVPMTGGGRVSLYGSAYYVPNLIVYGGTVYWVEYYGNVVRSVPAIGGPMTTLASSGVNGPQGITTDGVNVYWTEMGSDTVKKVPVGGGTTTTLASGLNNPVGIAVDGSYVYWTEDGSGKVMKIAK